MKIAIHSGSLSDGNASRGVGVYTKNLVDALQELSKKQKNFTIELVNHQTDISQFDLVHYPYFDFFFHTLPIQKKTNTVVTIHDTIPLIYPDHYPKGLKGSAKFMLQKHSLKSVKSVVTDSETSKKDIVRFLGVDKEKIHPVYLGPTVSDRKMNDSEIEATRKKYGLPKEYILYVGDVNWNKNLITLCRASKVAKVPLVIVGKAAAQRQVPRHKENEPLIEILAEFGNDPDILRLGFVDDILPLYKGALCLCQPSLYEGFGLSVLDAMFLGVPTIISKIQVFSELYDEAALFFDPRSEQQLSEQIVEMKKNTNLRKDLIKKGLKKSQQYSWEQTALNTYNVYTHVVTH